MTIIIEIGNFWHSFHPVYLYGFSMEQNCTSYPVVDLEPIFEAKFSQGVW